MKHPIRRLSSWPGHQRKKVLLRRRQLEARDERTLAAVRVEVKIREGGAH